MKYIVLDFDGLEFIFIFPIYINHKTMLDSIQAIKIEGGLPAKTYAEAIVVSAGFIKNGKCSGRSESLGKNYRPVYDTKLLQQSLDL